MNIKRLVLAAVLSVSALSFAADAPALWKKHCKSCHGDDGKAQTKTGKEAKIDDMSTEAWQTKWTDEKQKKVVLEGVKDTKMKSFKDKLSAEEVDAVVAHTRTFKK